MSNLKIPKKSIRMAYRLQSGNQLIADLNTPTTAASQGDPTNTCTTILTSTHFAPKQD